MGSSMTRKGPLSSTEPYTLQKKELRTEICNHCLENLEAEIILSDYVSPIYGLDESFLECSNCLAIISKDRCRHRSIQAPLGSVKGIGKATFEIAKYKRRININKSQEFNIENFPLAGKEDTDLKYLSNRGIVTMVEDSQ
jgi:hypothetical protein